MASRILLPSESHSQMPSPRTITRAPLSLSASWSVNGCRKWAESSCWIARVSNCCSIIAARLHVQQQVLALPRTDDGHEFLVLEVLDRGVHVDEALAQHGAQLVFGAQQVQRF